MPEARARRARSGRRGTRLGGDRPPARGQRFRRRVRTARHRLLRHARGGTPLRRPRAGAEARPRCGRLTLGRARWCGHPPVRRTCGSQRRAPRPGSRRLRRAHAGLPRSASTPPARARRATPRGAGGAGREEGGTACRAPGRCRCRTTGTGRPERLGPGERREARSHPRPPPARRGGRGARVPRGGRKRAHAPPCPRHAWPKRPSTGPSAPTASSEKSHFRHDSSAEPPGAGR